MVQIAFSNKLKAQLVANCVFKAQKHDIKTGMV